MSDWSYTEWAKKTQSEQIGLLKMMTNDFEKAREAFQKKLTKPKEEPRYKTVRSYEEEQKIEYKALLKNMNLNLISKLNEYSVTGSDK